MEERVQKILARAGYGSRRSCEQLISEGRVKVNTSVAVLGSKADITVDKISVDGRAISASEPLMYIMLYKPRNVISAVSTPDPRHTVRDLVPLPGTLYPVGRLDVDSEGLLILTNDGDLTNQLTHPRYEHEKEYRVLVARHPDSKQLSAWQRGLVLEDGFQTLPADVSILRKEGKGTWLAVKMREGHKRQIRETGKVIGLPVVKIIRVRMGTLFLGNLKPGQWRHLTSQEVESLKNYKN